MRGYFGLHWHHQASLSAPLTSPCAPCCSSCRGCCRRAPGAGASRPLGCAAACCRCGSDWGPVEGGASTWQGLRDQEGGCQPDISALCTLMRACQHLAPLMRAAFAAARQQRSHPLLQLESSPLTPNSMPQVCKSVNGRLGDSDATGSSVSSTDQQGTSGKGMKLLQASQAKTEF